MDSSVTLESGRGIRCGSITVLFYWQLDFKLARMYENKSQLWACEVSPPSVNSLLLMPQHVYLWRENDLIARVKRYSLPNYIGVYGQGLHLWFLMQRKQTWTCVHTHTHTHTHSLGAHSCQRWKISSKGVNLTFAFYNWEKSSPREARDLCSWCCEMGQSWKDNSRILRDGAVVG